MCFEVRAFYLSKTKRHKTKVNKDKNKVVLAHNSLIYIKNMKSNGNFFQKDLEHIKYIRNFAPVNKRLIPQIQGQNKLVDFSYRFLVFRF